MDQAKHRFRRFITFSSALSSIFAMLFTGCGGGGGGGTSLPVPAPVGTPTAGPSGHATAAPSTTPKPPTPTPTALRSPTPTPIPTPTPTSAAVAFNNWPTYGFDNARDGFNPNSQLFTAASIPALHLGWQQTINQTGTQTQPILATNIGGHQGLLFVGGRSGVAYAIDALTGAAVWSRSFGHEQMQCKNGQVTTLGIEGTAVYDPAANAVYMVDSTNSGPNAPQTITLYKLDPATGNTLGSVNVTPSNLPGEIDYSHAGLTLAAGTVYVGTGSTCDVTSWRGRLAAVNAASMTLGNTFFPAYNAAGSYSGGGVWGWGGVSVDAAGNVYTGVGNADIGLGPTGPQAPFQQTTNEQAGYSEHLVQLTSSLSAVNASYAIPYSFNGSARDLDLSGTPVLFAPVQCPQLLGIQGKSGQLNLYNANAINAGPIGIFTFSEMVGDVSYIGNGTYSPLTGLFYADVPTNQGGSIEPPGMVAIGVTGCSTPSILWHSTFGSDSYAIGTYNGAPRSAPSVTAGNVIFVASPTAAGTSQLWALDATTGALLNNGQPILTTGNLVRMPPVIDGKWMYVIDQGGNLYGLTVDTGVPAVRVQFRRNWSAQPRW